MRVDPDCKRGDEWPNLSELEGDMRDDKKLEFVDGHPFGKAKRPWRTIGAITLAWAAVVVLVFVLAVLVMAILTPSRARADEAAAKIFERDGECSIDADLRVSGTRRLACVERLDEATRLARGEMRVNERRRR